MIFGLVHDRPVDRHGPAIRRLVAGLPVLTDADAEPVFAEIEVPQLIEVDVLIGAGDHRAGAFAALVVEQFDLDDAFGGREVEYGLDGERLGLLGDRRLVDVVGEMAELAVFVDSFVIAPDSIDVQAERGIDRGVSAFLGEGGDPAASVRAAAAMPAPAARRPVLWGVGIELLESSVRF
ncbi:hypothetical protein [Glycomyces tenuis]|uniref:hypothetical protein n=1 Tax=Glycomyces tenuis TaxID=58116 RepID=UPI0012DC9A23|nr:hypothetical protein [Glycomyces tenuis]